MRMSGMVAIVDDGPRLARALGEWLDLHGLRATHYRSGESLLRAIHQNDGRLTLHLGINRSAIFPLVSVVFDLDLPDMSGLALAQALRRLSPNLPVVLVTSRDEEPWTQEDQPPAGICLRKPLDLDALEEAIFPSTGWIPVQPEAPCVLAASDRDPRVDPDGLKWD